MPYCSASNCNSRLKKGCGLHFFSFPQDKAIRKEWTTYCNRDANFQPGKHHKLCSLHFSKNMLDKDPGKLAEYGYPDAKAKLLDEAIPDIPLETTSFVSVNSEFEKPSGSGNPEQLSSNANKSISSLKRRKIHRRCKSISTTFAKLDDPEACIPKKRGRKRKSIQVTICF